MEVATPVNPTDFEFHESAYAIAPSTPKLMTGYTFMAPPELHSEFDELFISENAHRSNSLATVPFAWESKPGVPKSFHNQDHDFAFDVSGELHRHSSVSAADDLFHGGVIKPAEIKIKHPPAPLQNKERGRDRTTTSGLSSSRSRRTRSLPPFRGSELQSLPPVNMAAPALTLSAYGSGKWSKKWSFKDLFLFRSASEGRAMDRDPLKKYFSVFRRKHDEDVRNLTLRGDGSGSKRKGRVSAHELHYTVNRAVSNDMKKKTFLPYKQGILGRLAFNPTVQALSNGFGNSRNSN